MRAQIVESAGASFTFVNREVPRPGPGEVRIRVAACGVCHSDHLVKAGLWPGLTLPRAPGHEVAGTVDALGTGFPVSRWAPAWGSAGTAATTARAPDAWPAISSSAPRP